MPYFTSFQVKLKKGNEWEIKEQAGKFFHSLGNCLSWLNYRAHTAYENFYDKEGFIAWSIQDSENSYNGLFEISSSNFLEKVLDVEFLKNRLDGFRNESSSKK